MKWCAPMLVLIACAMTCVSSAIMQETGTAEIQDIQRIIQCLPACSHFRFNLEHGEHGTGVEQPYMGRMRAQGIKRAIFQVTAGLSSERASEPFRVTRRLYFREYDGPAAQITDPETLEHIRNSGLEVSLSVTALERARSARVFAGIDHARRVLKRSNALLAEIDFFDLPLLAEGTTVLAPIDKHPAPSLVAAAAAGDIVEVAADAKRSSKAALNEALMFAVARREDNCCHQGAHRCRSRGKYSIREREKNATHVGDPKSLQYSCALAEWCGRSRTGSQRQNSVADSGARSFAKRSAHKALYRTYSEIQSPLHS